MKVTKRDKSIIVTAPVDKAQSIAGYRYDALAAECRAAGATGDITFSLVNTAAGELVLTATGQHDEAQGKSFGQSHSHGGAGTGSGRAA